MKIGIDISPLAYPGTGVATYTELLVDNLLRVDRQNDYVLFYSSLRIPAPNKYITRHFKFPPLLLEQIWNRFHVFPIENLIGPLNIYHSSDWLEPPSKANKVTTIHDLSILKYPDSFTRRNGHDIVENQKRKLYWSKKETKIFIAVSENTKQDIIDLLEIKKEQIRVIYEASDPFYFHPIDNIKKSTILNKYGLSNPFLLLVGTREPRKNLAMAIKAYKLISQQQPQLQLVVAGKYGWGKDLDSSSTFGGTVKLLGYVPKEDLNYLYHEAECFIYPSLYEGFGLPILDAMSAGCPVVASNRSSIPEIVKDAGVLIDPDSAENIANGVLQALSNKQTLRSMGLKRAREFTWEKTALQTLKIYQEANTL